MPRSKIQLGDMAVDVVRKDIKNVHLSVHPPTGRVTIAAPSHMSLDTHPRLRHHQARLDSPAAEKDAGAGARGPP